MIQGMRLVFSNVTGILFLCMWNMSDFHKIIYSVSGKGSFVTDDIFSVQSVKQEVLADFQRLAGKAKQFGIPQAELYQVIDDLYTEGRTGEAT